MYTTVYSNVYCIYTYIHILVLCIISTFVIYLVLFELLITLNYTVHPVFWKGTKLCIKLWDFIVIKVT